MRDLFPEDWRPNLRRFFLALDSWVDSSLFRAGRGLRESYERFSTFMDRFHVAGWRRLLSETMSEAATLGTAGMVLMLALAIPAFRMTSDDDWLKKSELSVTFLDRYGNEVGSRGVRHNDSIPLDQFPDHLIKAVLATEDRRFYDHFGIDIAGTFRALVTNARAGGVVQGGSGIAAAQSFHIRGSLRAPLTGHSGARPKAANPESRTSALMCGAAQKSPVIPQCACSSACQSLSRASCRDVLGLG